MTKIESKIVSAQVVKPDEPKVEEKKMEVKRPTVLRGETHKLTNHAKGYNLYLTVNYHEGKPFEVFVDGSHTDATEWVKSLSRLMSAMLRSHDETFNLEFIARELMLVHSSDGYHTGGKDGFVAGVVQHIGRVLLGIHKAGRTTDTTPEPAAVTPEPTPVTHEPMPTGKDCPKCGAASSVIKLDGCDTCTECGDSKCG